MVCEYPDIRSAPARGSGVSHHFSFNERRSTDPDFLIHWHESLELLYFVDGEGFVTADGLSVQAAPGDMVVINSGQLHEIYADRDVCRYYCLIVDKAFCDGFQLPVGDLLFSAKIRSEEVDALWRLIIGEMERKEPYYKQRVKAASLELIVYLCRNCGQSRSALEGVGSRRTEMVKEAVRYIQASYCEPLTVEEIAANVGFSKFYFSRAFKAVTGYSAIAYVNFLRCQHARKLLQSGKYNVGQSAAMSGFPNLSYFARQYRRQFGCLPSQELQDRR